MSCRVRNIELLAPAKELQSAVDAVDCGADAVYIGAAQFGARHAATNSVEDIAKVVEYAHRFGVKVYATLNTLIFDEVDTGISGSAAEKVGLKLKEVSNSRQVLCVTHQAQIAALADSHYLIEKQFENDRTYTDVTLLDHIGRVNELARIIGGVNITDAARSHAEDMLHIHDH